MLGYFDPSKPGRETMIPMADEPARRRSGRGHRKPALVPLPGAALALMPTATFPGYPFYVAGEAGPPPAAAVLDFDIKILGRQTATPGRPVRRRRPAAPHADRRGVLKANRTEAPSPTRT